MNTKAILKIILGIVLVIAGLWLIMPISWCGSMFCQGLWHELWIVVKGSLPAMLVLIGILIVWIEAEELKD